MAVDLFSEEQLSETRIIYHQQQLEHNEAYRRDAAADQEGFVAIGEGDQMLALRQI